MAKKKKKIEKLMQVFAQSVVSVPSSLKTSEVTTICKK